MSQKDLDTTRHTIYDSAIVVVTINKIAVLHKTGSNETSSLEFAQFSFIVQPLGACQSTTYYTHRTLVALIHHVVINFCRMPLSNWTCQLLIVHNFILTWFGHLGVSCLPIFVLIISCSKLHSLQIKP
jgi:hypothetical protein